MHMRCWPAVAVLLLGVGLPACAQRGGGAGHGGFAGGGASAGFHGGAGGSGGAGSFGGGAGRSSGFARANGLAGANRFSSANHFSSANRFNSAGRFGSAGEFRSTGGFRGNVRPGFAGPASRGSGPGRGFAGSSQRFGGNGLRSNGPGYPGGPAANRPVFFSTNRGAYGAGNAGGRGYPGGTAYGSGRYGEGRFGGGRGYPYAPGFGYLNSPFFLGYGFGFPLFDDEFDLFGDAGGSPGYGGDDAGTAYAGQAIAAGDPGVAQPYTQASPYPSQSPQYPVSGGPFAGDGPADGYVTLPTAYASQVGLRAGAQRPLAEEDALTLIFKDGRQSEQIHNYALTRTTLFVTDARMREIPLEELDLPATMRVNREAGVAFQLP